MQGDAIVACNCDPQALRRKGDAFNGAFLGKFLRRAIGKTDEGAFP